MFSAFLLLAFLCKPKVAANTATKQVTSNIDCCEWQLLPRHKRTTNLERAYKGYHISLLHVATGAYRTYDTASVTPNTSNRSSNATTLCLGYSSEQEHSAETKVADGSNQHDTIKVTAIIYIEHITNTHDARRDSVSGCAQEHRTPDVLEASLVPEKHPVHLSSGPEESTVTTALILVHPIPRREFTQKSLWKRPAILDDGKLSQYLVTLQEADEAHQKCYNKLEPTAAPITDYTLFGVAFDEGGDLRDCAEPDAPINLALYRAIEAAKTELNIDQFNPAALVDGQIKPGTIEATFINRLPRGLRRGFKVYLDLLDRLKHFTRHKPWKPQYRLDRDDAEFLDNVFLEQFLKQDDPMRHIPYGRNGLISEYWNRRGLDFGLMKARYWNSHRKHAKFHGYHWLSLDNSDLLNWHEYMEYYEPFCTAYDLEIKEMERLPIEEVGCHPCKITYKAFARAYESWEPKQIFGEEVFPDCAEGHESYKSRRQIEEAEKEWQRGCAKVKDGIPQLSSQERDVPETKWGEEEMSEEAMVEEFF
ncbi:hypothetical protein J1614_010350 [Plenodomus biglobosus]|nr:hypothetical protein J1614_010350 [Plenodomus biglobosus]